MLEIEENNIAGPNGQSDRVNESIKKRFTKYAYTIYIKSPMPEKINTKLLEKFGRESNNGRKKLHTTCNAVSKNTLLW